MAPGRGDRAAADGARPPQGSSHSGGHARGSHGGGGRSRSPHRRRGAASSPHKGEHGSGRGNRRRHADPQEEPLKRTRRSSGGDGGADMKVRHSGDKEGNSARSGGRQQMDRADEMRRRGDDSRRREGRRREEDRSSRNDDRRQDGRQKSDEWQRSGDKRSWEDWPEERHRDRKIERPRHKHDMSQRQDGRVREGGRQDDAIGRPRNDDRRQAGDDRRHSASEWMHEEGHRHFDSRGKRNNQTNMDRHADHSRHHADDRLQRGDDRGRADDRGRMRGGDGWAAHDDLPRSDDGGRTSDVRHGNDGHADAAPQEWRDETRPAPLPPPPPPNEDSGMASASVPGDEQTSQLSQPAHPAQRDKCPAGNQMAEDDDRREQSHAATTAAGDCLSDRSGDKPAEQPIETAITRGTEEDRSSEHLERDAGAHEHDTVERQHRRGQRSFEDDERCSAELGDDTRHESPDGSDCSRSAGWDDDEEADQAAEDWCSEADRGEGHEEATGVKEEWKEEDKPAPPWREDKQATKKPQKWQRHANQQGKRPWVPKDWQDSSGGRGQKKEKWEKSKKPDLEIPVDEGMMGRIIGKAGCNLNSMRKESGATIECDDQTTSVKIWGDSKTVKLAKRLVLDAMDNARQFLQKEEEERQGAGRRKMSPWRQKKQKPTREQVHTKTTQSSQELVFPLPRSLYITFVGPGASNISEIKNKSGANIRSDKGDHTCRVTLRGTSKQIAAARKEVLRLRLEEEGEEEVEVHVLKSCRKALNQARLQAIRRQTNARVTVTKGITVEEYDTIRIKGTSWNVEQAWCRVMEQALAVSESSSRRPPTDASRSADEDAVGSEIDEAESSVASCSETSRTRKGRTEEGCQMDRMEDDASPQDNSFSAEDSESECFSESSSCADDVSRDEGRVERTGELPALVDKPPVAGQAEPKESTPSSEAIGRSSAEDGPGSPDSPLAEQDPPRNESSQAQCEGTGSRSADGESGQAAASHVQAAALSSSASPAALALMKASKRGSVGKEIAAATKSSETSQECTGENATTLKDGVALPSAASAAAASAAANDAPFNAPGLTIVAKAKSSTPPVTEGSGGNSALCPQEAPHQSAPASVGAASGEQGGLAVGAPVIVKPREQQTSEKLPLPENFSGGVIIGPKGETVRKLEQQSGAGIRVDQGGSHVTVTGPTAEIVKRGVEKVKEIIEHTLEEQQRKGKGRSKGWDSQGKGAGQGKQAVPPPPRPPASSGNGMPCPAQSMVPATSDQSNGTAPHAMAIGAVGAVGAVGAAGGWRGPRTPAVIGKSMGKDAGRWGWEHNGKGAKAGDRNWRQPSGPVTIPPRGKPGKAGSCKGSCKGGCKDWMSHPGGAMDGYNGDSSMDSPLSAANFAHRPIGAPAPENASFVQGQLQSWQPDVPESGACGQQQQQQQEPPVLDQPQTQFLPANVDLQHVSACAEPRRTTTAGYGQTGSTPGFAEESSGVLTPPPGTFTVPSEWQVPPGGGGFGQEISSYRSESHGSTMMPSPEQQAQAAGSFGDALPASEFSMEMWNPPGPDTEYGASAPPLRGQQFDPPQQLQQPHQLCNQQPDLSGWYQTSMAHGCGAQQEDAYTSTSGQRPPDFGGLMGGGGLAPANVVDV